MRKYFALAISGLLVSAVAFVSCGDKNDGPDQPVDPVTPEYAVGDFYSKDFVKGIVVSVDETGSHGLLVSLKQTKAAWSYKYEEAMGSQPGTGAYNTNCVYKVDGWEDNYPGFLWVSQRNVGKLNNWFVPSLSELASLYKAYSGHETNDQEVGFSSTKADEVTLRDDETRTRADETSAKAWFNKCLTDNGGEAVSDGIYWSSNETGPSIAYAFSMATGTTVSEPNALDKKNEYYFRAMAEF